MKIKKLLAGICTGALAISLITPAFAAGTAMDNPTSTEFEGSVTDSLTVSVKVLAAAKKLYVNPYGMSYSLDDGEVKAGDALAAGDTVIKETATAAGFFSDTAVIQNNGKTALPVSVTLTSTLPSGSAAAVAASAPSAGNNNPNTLVGNFEITDAAATTGTVNSVAGVITVTPDWDSNKKQTVPIPAVDSSTPCTPTTTDTHYTLAAVITTTDAASGLTSTAPSYAAFRLVGDAYLGTDGSGDSIEWLKTDLVNVIVAFSFGASQTNQGGQQTPPTPTTYSITANAATGDDDGGAYVVDKTTAAENDTVTITVTPDGTNTTIAVTVTGADSTPVSATAGSALGNGDVPYTFTMPAQNVTIDVAFSS